MRGGLTFASVALTGLISACGSPPDPGPFTIRYELDTGPGGCSSADCGAFGMSCGAVLSIRITDADTGAVIVTNGQPASLCEPVDASSSLCGLANLPPGTIFFDLPPRTLRIEVSTWSADTLEAAGLPGTCPDTDIFDLSGHPLPSFTPQPAFAGAAYFDAGSSLTEAIVPLACTDPVQLDTLDCAPEQVRVRATIIDLENPPIGQGQSALPDSLLVRMAGVRQVIVNEEILSEIDSDESTDLDREATSAFFSVLVSEAEIPNPTCVVVLELTAQATATVVCDNYEPNSQIDVNGAAVTKPVLNQLLAAVDLGSFPPEGLIVGRVYDVETGVGIAGVSVVPVDAADAVVGYLNSSRDDTLGDRTFDNGYFIASGVPFGTAWTVAGAPGMTPVRAPVAGLIRNQLTVLPIAMQVDSGPF